MDPDANLAEQRELAAAILAGHGMDPDDAERLAELVQAMDGWLSGHGYPPQDWRAPQPVRGGWTG